MSKHKRRSGLQKDFESIFQGVWIPKKPRRVQTPDTATPPEQPAPPPPNEHIEQIEQITKSMKCSKDFECYKSGFEKLCKIKNIGDGKVIECSPENRGQCEYRFRFMGKDLCKCQLRHYQPPPVMPKSLRIGVVRIFRRLGIEHPNHSAEARNAVFEHPPRRT